MKTIELNEQAQSYLIEMLNDAIDSGQYGETNKAIMRHILSKLEDEKEEVDLEEIEKHEDSGTIINTLTERN